MKIRITNFGGLNLKISPLLHKEGEMIRCLNVENDQIGAKKKRPGYITYLGTPDTNQVNTLFSWTKNSGTQLWTYRASGSLCYYSTQGTGAWTVCGNGTIGDGSHIGHTVLEDTLILGDGIGSTRHTTNGTSFTNTSASPVASCFAEYQNRIWCGGTSSDMYYSTTGTASDWTSDSSSIKIPGAGKINQIFKANDRLGISKNSGLMFRYDGYNLVDMATNLGPTSPYSIGETEDYRIYLNRLGFFGYGGVNPELISNPVEKQIYNDAGNGIAGTVFDNAPGVSHRYDYLCSVGTVKDDLTDEEVANCILKYDYQLNDWDNWKFANKPTAWHSYKDANGNQQLIFGDESGQCYTYGGTALNDNGNTVEVIMEGVIWGDLAQGIGQEHDKKWNYYWVFANPGCQAQIQFATAETFTKGKKKWIRGKPFVDGVSEGKFPETPRSKLLFWKVTEASRNARFHLYSMILDITPTERG